jgi:hypothetical protein
MAKADDVGEHDRRQAAGPRRRWIARAFWHKGNYPAGSPRLSTVQESHVAVGLRSFER